MRISDWSSDVCSSDLMAERHIGAVLIGEGNRLQGIFTERDLLIRVIARGLDPDATQLKEVMTPDPDTVGPNDWASLALERMRSPGYRHVPVVDDGIVVGIVSPRDLSARAKRELEEDPQQRDAFIFDTSYGHGTRRRPPDRKHYGMGRRGSRGD